MSARVVAAAAAALLVWTVVLTQLPRVVADGPELVAAAPVAEQPDRWVIAEHGSGAASVAEGVARLRTDSCAVDCRVTWTRSLEAPERVGWLEVSARIRPVRPGPPSVSKVVLSSRTGAERIWVYPRVSEEGRWRVGRQVVHADLRGRTDLRVGAVLAGEGGALDVDWIRVRPVRRSVAWTAAASATALAWAVGLLGLGAVVARQTGRRGPLIAAVLLLVLGVGMGAPHAVSRPLWASAGMPMQPPDPSDPALLSWRPPLSPLVLAKLGGHLVGFGTVGLVLGHALPERRGRVVGGMLVVAVASELLQGLTDDRTPSVLDVGVDMVGVGIGVLAGSWLATRLR